MKLFFNYLKTKCYAVLTFFLLVILLAFSAVLYQIPTQVVLYPAALLFLFGTVFLLIGFFRCRRKLLELKRIEQENPEMIQSLPAPETVCEQTYQELVRTLQSELASNHAAAQSEYRDMVDYYTVWAHQIKTPIASMKLALQNEDSELSRRLSVDLQRTQQYVDMVLAFLRLGSESSDYVFREYALDDIIRPSVRKFASEFIGRKLSLTYEPIMMLLVTDQKWLAFVLEQLLSNALKYTREGGIRIFMKDSHTLCISDTGIGIVPEDIPRIFEKGYTGHNGRIQQSASGLGLHLCRRICDRLGIGISIASTVGVGTEVSLDISQKPAHVE